MIKIDSFWNEFRRNFFTFIITLLMATLLGIVYSLIIKDEYLFYYNIEIWEEASQISIIILPFIVTLPSCLLLFEEKRSGYLKNICCRENIKIYIRRKIIIGVLYGFLLGFLTSFFIFMFDELAISDVSINNPFFKNNEVVSTHFYGEIFTKTPWLYVFLLSLWRGVIGAIYSYFGCILALKAKYLYIVLSGPFVWELVSSVFLAIIGVPEYSVLYSYLPDGLSYGRVNLFTMLVGPIVSLVCFIIIKNMFGIKNEAFD